MGRGPSERLHGPDRREHSRRHAYHANPLRRWCEDSLARAKGWDALPTFCPLTEFSTVGNADLTMCHIPIDRPFQVE
ncbi:hypothetical protein Ddc_13807 [Ditylenchus destructor]|nr:hypothetical protein Ddc_13807 [Ditylenchus destructor]